MNTEIRAICDAAAIAMTINIKIISSGYLQRYDLTTGGLRPAVAEHLP